MLLTITLGWSYALIPLWVFGWVGAWLGVIDARTRLLPNRVLYPALVAAALLLPLAALLERPDQTSPAAHISSPVAHIHGPAAHILGAALGWLLGWGLMHLVWRSARGGIGYGDVRLSGYIGCHLGYFAPTLVLVALTLGFAIAAVAGSVIAVRRRNLRIRFALGPYLIGAALVVVSFHGQFQPSQAQSSQAQSSQAQSSQALADLPLSGLATLA